MISECLSCAEAGYIGALQRSEVFHGTFANGPIKESKITMKEKADWVDEGSLLFEVCKILNMMAGPRKRK